MKRMKPITRAVICLLAGLAPGVSLGQGVSVGGVGVSAGVSSGGANGSATSGLSASTGNLTGALNGTIGTAPISEQENALQAVKTNRSLGLDKILAIAKRITGGDIIDAQLITVRGVLLYDLKVLNANGDVSDLFLYALSGEIVENIVR